MKAMVYSLGMVLMVSAILNGCVQAVHIQPQESDASKTPEYRILLGKSLADTVVTDFLVSNNCSDIAPFHMCKDIGMALWIDSGQIVKTVCLYAGNADGFRRYQGALPFGLSFYDPMWKVEEKLKKLDTNDMLQEAGLPDETASPDHFHYWAIYRRLNLTVIYDSPGLDEDAYIYAILVSE